MNTEKKLVYVATDGHRLAISEKLDTVKYAVSKDVTRSEEMRSVQKYSFDPLTGTYTPLVENNFPDFVQVIPKNHTLELTFSPSSDMLYMLKAIKAAKGVYGKSPQIIIDLKARAIYTPSSYALKMSMAFSDVGVSLSSESGATDRFGINALYLLDTLTTLKKVHPKFMPVMMFNGPTSALRFGLEGFPIECHLIAPMIVNESEPAYRNIFSD